MKFTELSIPGAFAIDLEKRQDDRGFFARMICLEEFDSHNITFSLVQMNNSASVKKGTVRGLHYQSAPYEEAKLFRCISGKAFAVIVDLRKESPTFKKWLGVELTPHNRTQLYMPKGCAAGYMSLEDNTEMIYGVNTKYEPSAERGLRWNDAAFNIDWPIKENVIVSDKDAQAPDFIS